jgi:hypothetical protein
LIQFIISDVSDTHYFERYHDGKLQRKFITTGGEVAEDIGEGFVDEEVEIFDKIWEYIEHTLGIDENDILKVPFERYSIA